MKKPTILCIDDENDNIDALERIFRKKYTVLKASSAMAALQLLETKPEISVIVTDQRMPGMTGIEFLEKISADYPHTSRILLTGYTDLESVISAINKGQIFRYIPKPWEPDELLHSVDQASEKYELAKNLTLRNQELSVALEELRVLDVAKNNFMILINHELKTPLTSILSFSDLLKETPLNDDQKIMLSRLQKSAERLRTLIEDVLLIVRSETNQLKLDFQKNTFLDITDILNIDSRVLMQTKSLHLIQKMTNMSCWCDVRLMGQVLSRLIHNSCKFGKENSDIVVTSEATPRALRFSILNMGAPISQKIIDRVFNPFYIDENIMHHSSGMGLGLSVCQTILRQHHSRLQIENTPQGVKVYFDIWLMETK